MKSTALSRRVLILTTELSPFAKMGEVADVIGNLARDLARLGHDVRVAMPRYEQIDAQVLGLEPLMEPLTVPMDHRQEMVQVYAATLDERVPVYFFGNARYFGREAMDSYGQDAERFIFFCRAAIELVKGEALGWRPDVVHCHDWQTAIVPNWLNTLFIHDPELRDIATVFTVHRLSQQGIFGYRVLQVAGLDAYGFIYHPAVADLADVVHLLGRGVFFADMVTTVSEGYAKEIQTSAYGDRMDALFRERREDLVGILNGIDVDAFDPRTDSHLVANYGPDTLDRRALNKAALQREWGLRASAEAPLIGMVSRLTDVKGFDLLKDALDVAMTQLDVQFAIMGVGDQRYHDLLAMLRDRYVDRIAVRFAYDDEAARCIYAGSDLFIMPSRVEPCGLGQLLAMRYGSIPIVRVTGGLGDTVEDYDGGAQTGTGFTFDDIDSMALYTALVRAVEVYRHRDLWRALQQRAMACDFSSQHSAERYVEVYRRAMANRQNTLSRGHDASVNEIPGYAGL